MSNLFYVYIAAGVLFLLVEMMTATLYGLSVSIACFVLAFYVYITGDVTMTIIQWLFLAGISASFSVFLPKLLKSNTENLKSGLDAHIWELFRLERVGSDWKVKIDGVDYLIDDDSETPEFEAGKKVRLESHKSGILIVSVVK